MVDIVSMSAKSAWKAALADYTLSPSKRGRTPAPSLGSGDSQNSVSDSQVGAPDIASSNDQSQIQLLKAVIASQKVTIDHYQKDFANSLGKLNAARSALKKMRTKLHGQRDYDVLKAACDGDFHKSFVKGQKKVTFVHFNNLQMIFW